MKESETLFPVSLDSDDTGYPLDCSRAVTEALPLAPALNSPDIPVLVLMRSQVLARIALDMTAGSLLA
jgi:hypothetical protein